MDFEAFFGLWDQGFSTTVVVAKSPTALVILVWLVEEIYFRAFHRLDCWGEEEGSSLSTTS